MTPTRLTAPLSAALPRFPLPLPAFPGPGPPHPAPFPCPVLPCPSAHPAAAAGAAAGSRDAPSPSGACAGLRCSVTAAFAVVAAGSDFAWTAVRTSSSATAGCTRTPRLPLRLSVGMPLSRTPGPAARCRTPTPHSMAQLMTRRSSAEAHSLWPWRGQPLGRPSLLSKWLSRTCRGQGCPNRTESRGSASRFTIRSK